MGDLTFSFPGLSGDRLSTSNYGEIEIPKNCVAVEINEVIEIIQINKKMTYESVKKIITVTVVFLSSLYI